MFYKVALELETLDECIYTIKARALFSCVTALSVLFCTMWFKTAYVCGRTLEMKAINNVRSIENTERD